MFAKLPEEIFQLILSYLDSKDAVFRLARAARPFYNRLAPTLYASIETTCFCVGIHRALVHNFLLHPELALSVRRLRLGRVPWCASKAAYSDHQHTHYECPESREKLVGLVRALSHRDWELTQWLEDLERGHTRDPWLALLLYLLPNLETLELFWGGTGTRYSEWVLKRNTGAKATAFGRTRILSVLHTATIKVLEDEGKDFHLPRLAPFFQMDSMRTFRGFFLTDRLQEYNFLPPNSSPITHLELLQCSGDTGFVDLVAPCKNLQSFTYTNLPYYYHGQNYSKLFFPPLHPATVLKALAPKRDSLHSVAVSFSRRFNRQKRHEGVYGRDWFGPATQFSHLRHLHIDASNFMGRDYYDQDEEPEAPVPFVEYLPATLESLWLSDMECARLEPGVPLWDIPVWELELVVKVAKDRFPNLKRIDMEGPGLLREGAVGNRDAWKQVYPDYLHLLNEDAVLQTESLRSACLQVGIEFRLRDLSVEAYFEDVDDPFLFVRCDDDSDPEF